VIGARQSSLRAPLLAASGQGRGGGGLHGDRGAAAEIGLAAGGGERNAKFDEAKL